MMKTEKKFGTKLYSPRWLWCAVLVAQILVLPAANGQVQECPAYREPQVVSKNFDNALSVQYLAPNGCPCVNGMSDLHCSFCETDEGCQTENSKHTCQKGIVFGPRDTYKSYKCRLFSFLESLLPNGKLSVYVDRINKTAHMSIFSSNATEPINGEHLINCNGSGCIAEDGGTVTSCELVTCSCTDICDKMTRTLAEEVISGNPGRFQATDRGEEESYISVDIEGSPFLLEAMCHVSTCSDSPPTIAPTQAPTTEAPTAQLTDAPTRHPTNAPTAHLTDAPIAAPAKTQAASDLTVISDATTNNAESVEALQCPAYRQPDDPNKDYEHVEHGKSIQYLAPNGCSCVDGMSDLNCAFCETDEGCQTEHSQDVCQDGFEFGDRDTYKSYKCTVSGVLESSFPNGKLSAYVDKLNKTVQMSIYNWDMEESINGGHAIDCVLSDCDIPVGATNISCGLAICNCTDQCNGLARTIVHGTLSGKPAQVLVADEQGGKSHIALAMEGAPFDLEAMCTASACVSAPPEAPTSSIDNAEASLGLPGAFALQKNIYVFAALSVLITVGVTVA
ncbi:ABC-2 type transporter [Seminavis robusta]|uniref:ABC-2 type transporter n=1 Tax=Seminavis robusta TaxID=568900 RepID=A0A9N8D5A2_9STRA|nr:ABC-2 type transporter [Seminavis robusta]|eukprot:Sro4_g003190.1 ABC-2 type transporter (562) ;mRNA; f:67770-69620